MFAAAITGLLGLALLVGPPVSAAETLPADTGADYQLGGAYPPAAGVGIVVRDRSDDPVAGAYSVCYINAFQTQPGARRWWLNEHPGLVLRSQGRPVVDERWGEMLLDTGTVAKRRKLTRILGRWIARCADAGFDGVEPDNLDSWQRSRGGLRRRDNLALARSLIDRAHSLGMDIAQKNAAGVARMRLFDFAIVEQCQRYRECARFTRAYSGDVIEVEYRRRDFRRACRIRGPEIPIVFRDPMLRTDRRAGHRFATC